MRTIAIGDVHGDLPALARLLARLPRLTARDTLVFLGDYCDRGPDTRGVIELIRDLERSAAFRVVALRGNHEDSWVRSFARPVHAFLLHQNNGCVQTWRSFGGRPGGRTLCDRDVAALLDVRGWLPPDVMAWMESRPTWYEDELGIYVHAGLDVDDGLFVHPSRGREKAHLWSRDVAFFREYRGKRVCFGHTRTIDLPDDHLGFIRKFLHDPDDVWRRGDLVGLDTGAGMGGHLSAISLPDLTVYSSRP